MISTKSFMILLSCGFVIASCSSSPKTLHERSIASGSGQDGKQGAGGSYGQSGENGQAAMIVNCDGLIATAVYRTEFLQMWPEDVADMCSVRPATPEGIAKAHAGLDEKIARLFATGYLRDEKVPESFAEEANQNLEGLLPKMKFIVELENKIRAQPLTDFGCHRGKVINRHKEEHSFNVCIRAEQGTLSRNGDIYVTVYMDAFKIAEDGNAESSPHHNERVRLHSLPLTCSSGLPIFKNSSVESNGTQFVQTTSSSCTEFVIDSESVFPIFRIRFNSK